MPKPERLTERLEIRVPPSMIQKLRNRARHAGKDYTAYAREILEAHMKDLVLCESCGFAHSPHFQPERK